MPMGVKIYAYGRGHFRPFLIQHRPLHAGKPIRTETLGLEKVRTPSSHTEIKNAL